MTLELRPKPELTGQEWKLIHLLRDLQFGQVIITKEGGKIVNTKKTESVVL